MMRSIGPCLVVETHSTVDPAPVPITCTMGQPIAIRFSVSSLRQAPPKMRLASCEVWVGSPDW